MDDGSSGALLAGFYEFLLLRIGQQSNLAWPGLVERIAFPEGVPTSRNEADQALITSTMFELLDEFLAEIQRPHELRRLFHEYTTWAIQQPSYDLDLVRYSSSPPWPELGVDDAARLMGITRRDVFDLIDRSELRTARVGSQVVLSRSQVEEAIQVRSAPTPSGG
jgi:excisionase family DNA binding protein